MFENSDFKAVFKDDEYDDCIEKLLKALKKHYKGESLDEKR